jgi:hypothetical protein
LFSLATGCLAAAAIVAGAVLAAKLPLVEQVLVAVGGAGVGVLVPVGVLVASFWVLAFPRQRREARAELRLAAEPSDLAGLAEEFSAWTAAKHASRPFFTSLPMQAAFDSDHPLNTTFHERNDELARFDAAARGEYYARFRGRVTQIVGDDWPDPHTTPDLVNLAARVRRLAGDAQDAEAIAAAQGTPISSDHLVVLR